MNAPRRQIVTPRPFLKWVGGKGQLLPELLKRVSDAGKFGRYHEPFVGGGALFFEMARRNMLGKKQAYLSDNNPRLIKAYQGLKEDVEAVIAALKSHKAAHGNEYFYEVRDAHNASWNTETPVECAARIIYLNKTCFNGLYRENSRGEFNVPIGSYKNPRIVDEENLRAVAIALKRARIETMHFAEIERVAQAGDLVYFDPPYHPISATSSFTAYDKGGFNEDSQRLLAHVVAALTAKGVKVLLSNSDTPLIRDLYSQFTVEQVLAARNVNSKADRRGKITEVLVRNF